MLKRIAKTLGFKKKRTASGPHIVPPGSHPIVPEDMSRGASEVVSGLEQAGYTAYVVGGCVRDLLLGLKPKDFDVATNATPEEVKAVFRRAQIIGRRFRIVHVRFGREVIEVTTFRAHHTNSPSKDKNLSRQSKEGMLLRDNVFGSIDEDASRRDFSINAMYYHPTDNTIYDYADGLQDLEQKTLRIIGDAATRYREDPVRMLRAARFAAKLDFQLDQKTFAPIPECAALLGDISSARLFDESLKLLMSGMAFATYQQLCQLELFAQLYPQTAQLLDDDFYQALIAQAMRNTDARINNRQRVTPAFIYAALLWPPLVEQRKQYIAKGDSPLYSLQQAGSDVIHQQIKRTAIPKRFTAMMKEIWDLQARLNKRNGQNAARLFSHPRFRAAYDFLLLREQAGEQTEGLGDWWTLYQEVDEDEREAMIAALPKPKSGKRGRRPRRKPKADHAS
ncbi:MAG: polynucleotide adenylyltransferase PcnB [Gammaproteobacteria bacterium]|nr:polynucleotide adenylyltransferase PcnB [Gammaproteobacteria bacterium]MBQ0839597.1 polynucleotide adenylyltransferase PcnB [Gammaproteobacteria bacterium]